tara:strand:- start:383 stop:493 length:111 start_codon:yes stop_codon:yes gene_type:complete
MVAIEFLEQSFLDIDRAFTLWSVMECKIIEEILEVA